MADLAAVNALNVSVGNADIDSVHKELAAIAQRLGDAPDDEFATVFHQLIRHTEEHFCMEEELMSSSGFPHGAEHLAEHRQMLAEMHRFSQRHPAMARAYVRARLPERLNLHITRMDSLLAAYLRS